MRRVGLSVVLAATLVVGLAGLFSCEKEDILLPDRNLPPETLLTQAPPESTQANFRVHMYWYGRDADGVVTSFRYAFDDTIEPGSWKRTSRTDTIFALSADDPLLRYHEFYIAAIDNEGKADPTPEARRFFARDDYMPWVRMREWVSGAPLCTTVVVGGEPACLPPPSDRDTLLMTDSTPILFSWEGGDQDGEVVAYAFKLDNESYRWVDPDTTFWIYPSASQLTSGPHTFYIKAKDDAQAELRPAYRYRFVVNKDPNTTIQSLAYVPRGYTAADTLVEVNFQDDQPDTLPDACTIRVTWSADDIDGEVIRSFVQLRGPDLVRQQSWTSGWQDYPEFSLYDSKKLEGTLDGWFDLSVFALDDRLRSEGTPARHSFRVNFPPLVTDLTHQHLDSLRLYRRNSSGTPIDSTTLYDLALFNWKASDRDNDSTRVYFYYLVDGNLRLPPESQGQFRPDLYKARKYWYVEESTLSLGAHTFEVRGYNYDYDPRVRYGSANIDFEVNK